MKLVRSIHDNHRDLPADVFWTREEFKRLREAKIDEWRLLTTRTAIKFIDLGDGGLMEVLEKEWPMEEFRFDGKLKRLGQILIISSNDPHEELEEHLMTFWRSLSGERKLLPFAVYNRSALSPLNPFAPIKVGLRQFFKKKHIRKAKSILRRFDPEFLLLRQLEDDFEAISEEEFERARIRPKDLDKWKKRLEKVDLLDPDEEVIGLGRMRLRRNHWKVNSNLNRSGKFFYTREKLVLVRRKFMIFGFSLAALRPLEAFVRPANKIIVFIRMIYHYVSEPIKALVRARPAFGPALAGIAVYFTLLADQLGELFNPVIDWWRANIGLQIPDLDATINFAVENPQILTGFAGIFAVIRLGFLKAFFRGEELVVLPFEKANYILMEGNLVFGRWKVKGCNVVGASEGIEYKMHIFDLEMATRFFVSILTFDEAESEQEATAISQEISIE